MKDYVEFLENLYLEGSLLFQKGKLYEILDESDEWLFIQTKKRSNECSQIPKSLEGSKFKYVK